MSKKQKVDLIEELTTHKCDYQTWPLKPVTAKYDFRPREEPAARPIPPAVRIDPQSHAPYNSEVHVPFDLYLAPKPIVGTDPRKCSEHKSPPKYVSSVGKVSLNTILPPALPLEEIDNEEDLQRILNYTYTGWNNIYLEEGALKTNQQPNPPSRVASEGNDLRFKPNIYPALPPGWIAAARHWDCLQSRHLGDPYKAFWERRGPEVECGCCCNPLPTMISQETKEEIKRLQCEGKLRLPYDISVTGYGGYRNICARGVPLEKSQK